MMEKKLKILIIDDEQGLRDMLSFALGQEGYIVLTAKNGKEGTEKVTKEEVDVVISDIKMPEMDGITVLGKIKEIKPEVEVIMATGYGTMETAIESLRKGAFDYINKPFNIDELLFLINKVSAVKQLKSQLVSLKEFDRLKDEFLTAISHEFRTPLTSISGAIELLMDDEGVDNEEKLDYLPYSAQNVKLLEIIKRQTERIRGLVNNLLDFAKMETGFWELKKQGVSVIKLVDDAVKGILLLAEKRRIEIKQQVSLEGRQYQDAGLTADCDSEQIVRVLTNLLSNSIKYTQESGRIAVWYERIPAGAGSEIKFTVEDNGKGIAAENLEKVFDRFYRVDQSLIREEGGVGLGLPICKKVIELHKGRIWVESEGLGRGSRFIFTIPINENNIKGR
ncbi:MAG: hypothetical protein A2297_09850 [Elusimicrobia bacterium RIFOXYB2_FULL_48_7]|nr:MAG: hypothetical protein A2297_09850 [Elusimicrobia bacterium RIFOXYB2_FULL_48_7]